MQFGIQLPHFGPLASVHPMMLPRDLAEVERILMRFIRDVRPGL